MMLDKKTDTCLLDQGRWSELRTKETCFEDKLPRPALFLDRDGVLNKDIGYVHTVESVIIHKEIVPIITFANTKKMPVILVTNQSGIARQYYEWKDFAIVNDYIVRSFSCLGGEIDAIYACAYHPEAALTHLRDDTHEWRKPAPGMLYKAARDLPICLSDSLIIGDRMRDMKAGKHAGLRQGVLLGNGNNNEQEYISTMNIHYTNRKTVSCVAIELLQEMQVRFC